MRRHEVNCVIERKIEEAKENVQISVNEFWVRILEKNLEQSALTKDEKFYVIDEIIKKVKMY